MRFDFSFSLLPNGTYFMSTMHAVAVLRKIRDIRLDFVVRRRKAKIGFIRRNGESFSFLFFGSFFDELKIEIVLRSSRRPFETVQVVR